LIITKKIIINGLRIIMHNREETVQAILVDYHKKLCVKIYNIDSQPNKDHANIWLRAPFCR